MNKKENNSPEKLNNVLEAIRKKLIGKHLNYQEIYAIMEAVSNNSLGDILTTYFAASGYAKGFSNMELYYLTRAMVETGERLDFNKKIVADKHSIGGVPGTRTTLVVVPIIAACGFVIPKSSSRAITSPDGTADDMEVVAPVNLSKEKIYETVKKTNGCIVWGGSFGIAPADDVIINVEKPLLFESYDKILVSIMAKKIAFGSNHVVIDLPYGRSVKVHTLKDAKIIKNKFEFLARKFNIKIKVLISKTEEPAGRGVGPVLEMRDALRILQQKENRPLDLEEKSINIAGHLLELCLKDSSNELKADVKKNYGDTFVWARKMLENGLAFLKMQEIIKAQGGNSEIDSEDLKPGRYAYYAKAQKNGLVKSIDIKNLTFVAKLLGAPKAKGAGVFLDKKIGEKVQKEDVICTLYSENVYNLKEGKKYLARFPIVKI